MDCSLPGSSIHGIFQARVLSWVSLPSLLFGRGIINTKRKCMSVGQHHGLTGLLSGQHTWLGSWPVRTWYLSSCQRSYHSLVFTLKKEWESWCVKLGPSLWLNWDGGQRKVRGPRTQVGPSNWQVMSQTSNLHIPSEFWWVLWFLKLRLVEHEFSVSHLSFFLSSLAHSKMLLIITHLPMFLKRTPWSLV